MIQCFCFNFIIIIDEKAESKGDLKLNDFAKALQALSEVKGDKYSNISDLIQNTDNDIKNETDLNNEQKKRLYQYLTYLFVGGLAGEVNVATGNMRPYPKGLNLRLKDMHIEEFKRLLDQPAFGNIINETGVIGNTMEIDGKKRITHACTAPSNVLNDAYRQVMKLWNSKDKDKETNKDKDKDLNTKLKEFVKLYNDSKKQIKEARHDAQKWYRCNAKRPFVNLWRMFKRGCKTQDFSYASRKYKEVFSLLDTSQKSNEIQK